MLFQGTDSQTSLEMHKGCEENRVGNVNNNNKNENINLPRSLFH